MEDVKVNYNSAKPARLGALACAQGTDIDVGPGQEKHLAHEAWHLVQQKQRRLPPTIYMEGVPINDDPALEHEADVMSERALRQSKHQVTRQLATTAVTVISGQNQTPVQLKIEDSEIKRIKANQSHVSLNNDQSKIFKISNIIKTKGATAKATTAVYELESVTDGSKNIVTESVLKANYNISKPPSKPGKEKKTTNSSTSNQAGLSSVGGQEIPEFKRSFIEGSKTHNKYTNLMAMDFLYDEAQTNKQDIYSFAHYSFDVVNVNNENVNNEGEANKKQNDHLTIENSLPAFIAAVKGNVTELINDKFLKEKIAQRMDKRDFNQILRRQGMPDVDNFNFRLKMAEQRRANIGESLTAKEAKTQSGQTIDIKTVGMIPVLDSDEPQVSVEEGISLKMFKNNLLEPTLNNIATGTVRPPVQKILDSIDKMANRMNPVLNSPEHLYLNKANAWQFMKFAYVCIEQAGLSGTPLKFAFETEGDKTKISIRKDTFEDPKWDGIVGDPSFATNAELVERVSFLRAPNSDVESVDIKEGVQGYETVKKALIETYWQKVVTWMGESR